MVPPAHASITGGLLKVLAGILYVPAATLHGTVHGPPGVGVVLGVLNGVLGGTAMVAGGALELAGAGFGIAKTVAPFVLPFLL